MGLSNLNSPLFWWQALAATEKDIKPVRFVPFLQLTNTTTTKDKYYKQSGN